MPLAAQDKPAPAAPDVFISQSKPGDAAKAPAPKRPAAKQAARPKPPPAPVGPATGGGWPNGASSINETYGDWALNCGTDNKGARFCTLIQAQVNKEGQRAFAIELRTSKDGSSQGTILMPFGLKLDAGVELRLDNKDIGHGLRFSTCLAQGCLLPVSFPSVGMEAIRNAKTFTVGALNASNDQPVTINVSLNGFAVAVERVGQLVGQLAGSPN